MSAPNRCQRHPPTVAAYLASLADAGLKASTINRRAAAITYWHRVDGEDATDGR